MSLRNFKHLSIVMSYCWADRFTQSNNRRSCLYFDYEGEALSLKQWSRKKNISYATLYRRVVLEEMPFTAAVTKPVRRRCAVA